MQRFISAFLLCLAPVGCNSGASDDASDVERVEPCIGGWWRDPVPSGCMCSGRAECDANDCEAVRIVRLGADGTHLSGFATLSPSTKSVTVVGEISQGTYKVEGDHILFEPPSGRSYSSTVECSDSSLVLNHVVKIRADEWLATALDGSLGISPSSPDEQGGG